MAPGGTHSVLDWEVLFLYIPSMAQRRTTSIDISIDDRSVRISGDRLERLIDFVVRAESLRLGRIDLAIVPPADMARYNRRYLNHSGPTDVISFDLSDAQTPGLSGQLIVCATIAREQAQYHGLTGPEELMIYVIHGLLHMAGYDDQSVRQAAKMHARQDELLSEFRRKEARRRKKC